MSRRFGHLVVDLKLKVVSFNQKKESLSLTLNKAIKKECAFFKSEGNLSQKASWVSESLA